MAIQEQLTAAPHSDHVVIDQVDQCIQLAQQGCPQALGQLYERCQRYLLLIANNELGDEFRAKLGPSDIVQETLLKAQRKFGRFEGRSDAELRAWLRTILLNSLRDAGRHFKVGSQRDLRRERPLHAALTENADVRKAAGGETPSKLAMAREQKGVLQQAMARLPEDYRQVVILRSLERRPFAEIGLAMNRSSEAARQLWLRAIDRLRELLGAGDDNR